MNWLLPSVVPKVMQIMAVRDVLKTGVRVDDAKRNRARIRVKAWRLRNPWFDTNAARNGRRKVDPDGEREKDRAYYARTRKAQLEKAKRYRLRVKARLGG